MGYRDKDTVGDGIKDNDGDSTGETDTLSDGDETDENDGLTDTDGSTDGEVVDSDTVEVWSGVGYALYVNCGSASTGEM